MTLYCDDSCRAFVPTAHLPSKTKLKVGQEVRGRVLERDAGAKKIVMTLKKALIGSKLPALAHLEVCHYHPPLPCTHVSPTRVTHSLEKSRGYSSKHTVLDSHMHRRAGRAE